MSKRNAFVSRQWRTFLLMLLFFLFVVGFGLYLRVRPVIVDTTITSGDTESESLLAYNRYEKMGDEDGSVVLTAAESGVNEKAQLLFLGLPDIATTQRIVDSLKQNNLSATFFVYGVEANGLRNSLNIIRDNGFDIGIAGNTRSPLLSDMSSEDAIKSITSASLTMQTAVGVRPTSLISLSENMNPALPYCAAAYDLTRVFRPTTVVTPVDFSSVERANKLVDSMERGTLLLIQTPQSGTQLGDSFPYLANALSKTNYIARAETLIAAAGGAQADVLSTIYTTEPAVAFTFSGLGNVRELGEVLDTLTTLSGVAVFYVTEQELEDYPDSVQAILSAGQQLGVGIDEYRTQSVKDIVVSVLTVQEQLRIKFDYTRELPLRCVHSAPGAQARQAAAALSMTLVSEPMSPVKVENSRDTDAEKVFADIYGDNTSAMSMGQLVNFQMRMFTKSDTLLSEYVQLIAEKKLIYPLRSLTDILDNKSLLYTYPLPRNEILPQLRDFIAPGQLVGSVLSAAKERYIGNSYYKTTSKLPGFTREEISGLNNSGIYKNDQNYIFLTFDDWGTDGTLNKLMDALEKHNAKGTFFVRSNNIHYNPNLLRSIALRGHTVGCHSHTHIPLADESEEKPDVYYELTPEELVALKEDLVLNWRTLQEVVGDIAINGVAPLIPVFRPPTLAVSKSGIEAVMDCGFTHVVSGSHTTHDYMAESADEVYKQLVDNTKSGAIFILHMSDNSIYTAEAVDKYLTYLEEKWPGKYKVVGMMDIYGISVK